MLHSVSSVLVGPGFYRAFFCGFLRNLRLVFRALPVGRTSKGEYTFGLFNLVDLRRAALGIRSIGLADKTGPARPLRSQVSSLELAL